MINIISRKQQSAIPKSIKAMLW